MKIDVARFADLCGRSEALTEENIKFRMSVLMDPVWLKALHLSRHEAGMIAVRLHAQLWKAHYGQSA